MSLLDVLSCFKCCRDGKPVIEIEIDDVRCCNSCCRDKKEDSMRLKLKRGDT